jgi:hypothetical protein
LHANLVFLFLQIGLSSLQDIAVSMEDLDGMIGAEPSAPNGGEPARDVPIEFRLCYVPGIWCSLGGNHNLAGTGCPCYCHLVEGKKDAKNGQDPECSEEELWPSSSCLDGGLSASSADCGLSLPSSLPSSPDCFSPVKGYPCCSESPPDSSPIARPSLRPSICPDGLFGSRLELCGLLNGTVEDSVSILLPESEWNRFLSRSEKQVIWQTFSLCEGPNLVASSFMLAWGEITHFRELCDTLEKRLMTADGLNEPEAFLAMFRCIRATHGLRFCPCQRTSVSLEAIRVAFQDVDRAELTGADIFVRRLESQEFRLAYSCLMSDFGQIYRFSLLSRPSLQAAVESFIKRQHLRIHRVREAFRCREETFAYGKGS